jgi:signal transduction histidine kinase
MFLLRFLPKSSQMPSPATPALDEDRLRLSLITAAVGCLFTALSVSYALLIWLFERPPAIYYALALEGFVTATSTLLLLRRGFLRAAPWVMLGGGTLAVLVPFLREGPSSQAACNFTIVIVMAALLVGWRGVLALGVSCAALVLGAGLLARRGLLHPTLPTAPRGVFALIQMSSLIVMLVIFDRVRLRILRAHRQLETRLLQAQRLEAVGRLAGGIAHDFNNLLTVILANVSLLSRSDATITHHPEVDDIHQAAERAAQLTRQLLAFSRRQKLEPRVFDLVALLREEEGILRRLIPETIRMQVESTGGPLWVHADPGQLSQVLVNLATNARDAMPDGGTLQISLSRAREVEGSGPHADATGPEGRALQSGAYACLRVRDTGAGMDPTTIERAFDPFFSTKEAGGGTGLGLAIVHGIVTQSGGAVRVTSQPGAGTQFSIYLPETLVVPPVEAPAGEPPVGTSERSRVILLVEDDAAVRGATARTLQSLGHRVIECAHPAEARAAWKSSAGEVDVVVSDVILPGVTGPRLVAELLDAHPVRVLFISGYLDDALKDPLLERAAFLPKPFSRPDLAAKLAAVLAAPPVVLPIV